VTRKSPLSASEITILAQRMLRDAPLFRSLCLGNEYKLVAVEKSARLLKVQYESGRVRSIQLVHLAHLSRELYRIGALPRNYFRDSSNSMRVFGWRTWHAPGAAMYAILPHLDPAVQVDSDCGLVVQIERHAP
jgi:hypothetical protein